jgi:hypothetical protein
LDHDGSFPPMTGDGQTKLHSHVKVELIRVLSLEREVVQHRTY